MFKCDQRFDIVIASNSGYPLDQNLYQTVKGMSAASKVVKRRSYYYGIWSVQMAFLIMVSLPKFSKWQTHLKVF